MLILNDIFLRKGVKWLIVSSVLIVLAFFTQRYYLQMDMSDNAGNTLSKTSQKLLKTLDDAVDIKVYIRPSAALQQQIEQLVQRYQRHKANISLKFIDPQTNLAAVKDLNIGKQGLIVVRYKGRMEKINFLDETSLSNAFLQLAHSNERWVSFLIGHGERHPQGKANFDLGLFSQELARRNINTQALNLPQLKGIPDNTALLVLSAPSVALLAGEIDIIQGYIKRGGNLLILSDPDTRHLDSTMQLLGVRQEKGHVMDNGTRLYAIDDPSFVLVSQYTNHPVTKGLQTMTLYPQAAGLTALKTQVEFSRESLLKTEDQIVLAMALTRSLTSGTQQRIVIFGDGDFLSNTFLGNVGNLNLGLRLFNWLTHNDQFIEIPLKTPKDNRLSLTPFMMGIMGGGFLFVLPVTFIIVGFLIDYRRKRH